MLVTLSEATARTGSTETPGRLRTLLLRVQPEALVDTPDGPHVDLALLVGRQVRLVLTDVTIVERGRFEALPA